MYLLLVFSISLSFCCFLFFFNDTATTEIYTLSLHDALPIWPRGLRVAEDRGGDAALWSRRRRICAAVGDPASIRSEEHTSELQSRGHLVCRLLLEKKKKKYHSDDTMRTDSQHPS